MKPCTWKPKTLNHEEHEGHEAREDRPSWRLCQGIIGCAIRVHEELGPGLLEATYSTCLAHELSLARIPFRREVAVPIRYKGMSLDTAFRLDLLVDDAVIVEIKAVDALLRVHESQLLTYLKLSGMRVGLLINFNVGRLEDGVRRLVR